MKLTYDYDKSLFLIHRNLTKEIFINESGVNDGYSLSMFSRMYDSIFSELIDLDKEFEKYYSFEYNSMDLFLWRKYNLKTIHINELNKVRTINPDCILYRKDEYSYGDYGIMQFAFSETMKNRIFKILMLKK